MKWMRRGGRMGRKKISIARISDERNRWAVKCHIDNHWHWQSSHNLIKPNPNTELTRQRKTVAKVSKDMKTFDDIWKHMATAKECWVINIRTLSLWIKTQHSWTKPKTKLSRFPNKCQHKKNVAPSAQFSLQWTLILSTFNFMQHLYHRQLKYFIHYI